MASSTTRLVVAGGLGTDFFAQGLPQLAGPGELVQGGKLMIGAGGKSRNIAEMLGRLAPPGLVAMVGRTAQDPFGLWRVPVQALERAGVNVSHLHILPLEANKLPQLALIAVTEYGTNQIYVIPGAGAEFCPQDIIEALPAFESAASQNGLLALSLEMPLATATYAVELAGTLGLRTVLDPGGMSSDASIYGELLALDIHLLKPNEFELSYLSGLPVTNKSEAQAAAESLRRRYPRLRNVLVTLGENGALLVGEDGSGSFAVPPVVHGDQKDSTGCGDQTMAALCASLLEGHDLRTAVTHGVLAGTLQFYRQAIVPVSREEFAAALGQLATV